MKREQSDERHMQYASPSCFIIVAILLFLSGKSNSLAISSFCGIPDKIDRKQNYCNAVGVHKSKVLTDRLYFFLLSAIFATCRGSARFQLQLIQYSVEFLSVRVFPIYRVDFLSPKSKQKLQSDDFIESTMLSLLALTFEEKQRV